MLVSLRNKSIFSLSYFNHAVDVPNVQTIFVPEVTDVLELILASSKVHVGISRVDDSVGSKENRYKITIINYSGTCT